MEGREKNGEPEVHIMTDDSPLQEKPNTPSFSTISDYNSSQQDTDDHNTPKTNLNVSTLLLS